MWLTNTNKWILVGCGGAVAGIGILLLSKNKILSMLGKNGSSITKHVLEDTEIHSAVQNTAVSLFNKLLEDIRVKTQARQLVQQITTDEDIKTSIRNFITCLFEDAEIKSRISALLVELLSNKDVTDAVIIFIAHILNNENIKQSLTKILDDPDIIIKFRRFIVDLIDNDAIKTLISQYGIFILSSTTLQEAGRDYLTNVLNSSQVKDSVDTLLTESIISNLNNENVQNELNNVLTKSMTSEEIQKNGADSLSNILKMAIMPSWWSSKPTNTDNHK